MHGLLCLRWCRPVPPKLRVDVMLCMCVCVQRMDEREAWRDEVGQKDISRVTLPSFLSLFLFTGGSQRWWQPCYSRQNKCPLNAWKNTTTHKAAISPIPHMCRKALFSCGGEHVTEAQAQVLSSQMPPRSVLKEAKAG